MLKKYILFMYYFIYIIFVCIYVHFYFILLFINNGHYVRIYQDGFSYLFNLRRYIQSLLGLVVLKIHTTLKGMGV